MIKSRGFWNDAAYIGGITAADCGGGEVGKLCGKWLGASLGASTGIPVLATLGFFGGRKLGYLVGYTLSSAAAKYVLDKYSLKRVTENLTFDYDISLKPSVIQRQRLELECEPYEFNNFAQSDSIGYMHNRIMYKVEKSKFSLTTNGSIDIEKLYDFIIDILINEQQLPVEFKTNKDIRNGFIKLANRMVNTSYTAYINNYTVYEIYKHHTELFKIHYHFYPGIDYDYDYAKAYGKITYQLSLLRGKKIKSYAKDLNNLIINSNISLARKKEMMYYGQAAVNSTICWSTKISN